MQCPRVGLSLAMLLSCASSAEAPSPSGNILAVDASSPALIALSPNGTPSPNLSVTSPAAEPLRGQLPLGTVVPRSVAMHEKRVPFVLLLHGYSGRGVALARHFHFQRLAEERGFVYLAPDGQTDSRGNRFWNAGPACCDFERTGVDHVAMLRKLIEEASEATRVDPTRIYVVGYSNGGFMAHRLGCDAPLIRGVLSVAGAGSPSVADCAHAPETVIEVHGDADTVVRFAGGPVLSRGDVDAHPGALETVTGWAQRKRCHSPATVGVSLDLEDAIPGAETERLQFACAPGIALLHVKGGTHRLINSEAAIATVLAALMK